jgi:hypothetical protein
MHQEGMRSEMTNNQFMMHLLNNNLTKDYEMQVLKLKNCIRSMQTKLSNVTNKLKLF